MKTAIAFMLRDVRSIPAPIMDAIRAALPTDKTNARTWNLTSIPVRWTQGDKKAALRRNATAAMTCNALIVMKGDKFTTAAIRAFRHRGRTCYYWTGSRLIEERISPVKPFNPEPSADANELDSITRQIFPSVKTIPVQPIIEAQIWMDAVLEAKERKELAAANFRGYRPVKNPNARTAEDRRTLAAALRAYCPNSNPARWAEPVSDIECSEDDVLHPRHTPRPEPTKTEPAPVKTATKTQIKRYKPQTENPPMTIAEIPHEYTITEPHRETGTDTAAQNTLRLHRMFNAIEYKLEIWTRLYR